LFCVDHQTHFHIYLNPPAPLEIGPHLLQAEGQPVSWDAPASALPGNTTASDATLQTEALALFDYSQTLITGEEFMFIMDVPYVPPQAAPVVLVQASDTSSQPDYLLKTCDEVPSAGGGSYSNEWG